jgi:hypothetical protein
MLRKNIYVHNMKNTPYKIIHHGESKGIDLVFYTSNNFSKILGQTLHCLTFQKTCMHYILTRKYVQDI